MWLSRRTQPGVTVVSITNPPRTVRMHLNLDHLVGAVNVKRLHVGSRWAC